MLSWELFRHYLLSRRAGALIRVVAWLCIAGVSIGVMSLVVVLSVMNGFNDTIKRKLLAVEPHLVVKNSEFKTVTQVQVSPIFQDLRSRPGVKAEVFETQDVFIRTVSGLYGGAAARGIDKETFKYILEEVDRALKVNNKAVAASGGEVVETPPPIAESAELEPGEIYMGVDLARSLGLFEGDKIVAIAPEVLLLPPGEVPSYERITIKGLLTTNIADIDSKAIFYARDKTFLHLKDAASREVGIELRLPDPNDFSDLRSELEKKGLVVESWIDRNSSLFYALKMEKLVMGMFLGLSALIASFSIVTVLVLLLTQKRKDIGVFMAMGLSPSNTRTLFIKVGMILSALGIGGGLVAGVVISILIDRYPLPILPDIYYDNTIPATVEPLVVISIAIIGGLIAFFSAWVPAKSHTELLPAEALRSRRAT